MIDLDLLTRDYQTLQYGINNKYHFAVIDERKNNFGRVVAIFKARPPIENYPTYSLYWFNASIFRWEKVS